MGEPYPTLPAGASADMLAHVRAGHRKVNQAQRDSIMVACPKCGAPPGTRCAGVSTCHYARMKALELHPLTADEWDG
jgi:hypothetical protein